MVREMVEKDEYFCGKFVVCSVFFKKKEIRQEEKFFVQLAKRSIFGGKNTEKSDFLPFGYVRYVEEKY